jgi:hypothetical protein
MNQKFPGNARYLISSRTVILLYYLPRHQSITRDGTGDTQQSLNLHLIQHLYDDKVHSAAEVVVFLTRSVRNDFGTHRESSGLIPQHCPTWDMWRTKGIETKFCARTSVFPSVSLHLRSTLIFHSFATDAI